MSGKQPNVKKAEIRALYKAVKDDNEPEVDRLLQDTNVTKEDLLEARYLLGVACSLTTPTIAFKLLAHGCDPNVFHKNRVTPLIQAINWNHDDLGIALLSAGADPCAADSQKWSPLHFAALRDSASIVAELLAHGANPNAQDKDGWTPLHTAINYGCTESMMVLLRHGVSLDVVDRKGRTPIGLAIEADEHDAALRLIAMGAQPSASDLRKDKDGLLKLPPPEAAARGGCCDLFVKMIDAGIIDASDETAMQSLRDQALLRNKAEVVSIIDAMRSKAAISEIIAKARRCASYSTWTQR